MTEIEATKVPFCSNTGAATQRPPSSLSSSSIAHISEAGYVGVVDERRGMHKSHPVKPVQICLRVPDVDEFYAYCQEIGVDELSQMFESRELKIRAFVFNDPEGYQIEIQQSIP